MSQSNFLGKLEGYIAYTFLYSSKFVCRHAVYSICFHVCVCMRVHISTELSVLLEAFKLDFCCLAEVYADTGAFDSVLTHGQPCMTDCFLKRERRRAANRGGIPKMCGMRQ